MDVARILVARTSRLHQTAVYMCIYLPTIHVKTRVPCSIHSMRRDVGTGTAPLHTGCDTAYVRAKHSNIYFRVIYHIYWKIGKFSVELREDHAFGYPE